RYSALCNLPCCDSDLTFSSKFRSHCRALFTRIWCSWNNGGCSTDFILLRTYYSRISRNGSADFTYIRDHTYYCRIFCSRWIFRCSWWFSCARFFIYGGLWFNTNVNKYLLLQSLLLCFYSDLLEKIRAYLIS